MRIDWKEFLRRVRQKPRRTREELLEAVLDLDNEDEQLYVAEEPVIHRNRIDLQLEDWPPGVKDGLVGAFLEDVVGEGYARRVYSIIGQPQLVAKVELTPGTFQNVAEWSTWSMVQFSDWADWFAPCRRISPCGTVLIQERTKPLDGLNLPEKLPDFLSDLKRENFGLINGVLVCHDYALNLLTETGLSQAQLKKANFD